MNTHLDCIPCLFRQALDAARLVSDDAAVHERILREVMGWLSDLDMQSPPPLLAQRIHRLLRETACTEDPYREMKVRQNRMAKELLPRYRAEIAAAADPLDAAVRLAVAANLIDMGAKTGWNEADVPRELERSAQTPLSGDLEALRSAIAQTRRILYLADNAGEIVFDRLLIEQLPRARVTAVVRGSPVINDATRADALEAGLDELVEIIDNGSDAPGTLLEDCSVEFQRRFAEADLILAKGQGNFETLVNEPGNIFFLFRIKCPVTAGMVGQPVGTHVLVRSRMEAAA
jgi:damage-control phosphatase, subfamily I